MKLLQLCIGLLHISRIYGATLYANTDRTRMLEISSKNYCTIYTNQNDIEKLKRLKHQVKQDGEFNKMFNDCFESTYRTSYTLIFPGTLWCGFGSVASNFTELGTLSEEDQCCRHHDLCLRYISGHNCKYNICNQSVFTCSHCDCDMKFRKCLHGIGSVSSELLAYLYFNMMGMSCFTELPGSPVCPLSEVTEMNCRVMLRQSKYSVYTRLISKVKLLTESVDFISKLFRYIK